MKEPQTPLGGQNQKMSSSRVKAFLIYSENSLYIKDINSLHLPYTYFSYVCLCVVVSLDANDCLWAVSLPWPSYTVSLPSHVNTEGLSGHILGCEQCHQAEEERNPCRVLK